MDEHPSFNEWMDDRLSPGEADAFRRHLAACPACRAEERRWSALRDGFKSIAAHSEPQSLSPYFETRFWALAQERRERAARWSRTWRPALSLAGLTALLLSLSWTRPPRPAQPETSFVSASLSLVQAEAEKEEAGRAAENLLDSVF